MSVSQKDGSKIAQIESFTWPAGNKILRYHDDAKDAELSGFDWQVFEKPRSFNMLSNIGERATVYFNTKDLALFISETTKNAYNRLGKFGFRDYNKFRHAFTAYPIGQPPLAHKYNHR